jgi:flagellar hook-associated protein 2
MATTSSISLGSVVTSGGKPRLSGTSSELDTEALVQALVEAKKVPAVRLDKRIDANDAKLAALKDLKTILADIRTAVAGLRNPPGLTGIDQNLFEKKDAFLSSDTATAPGTILGVAVANRAQPGSYQLAVQQLATTHKLAAASVDSTGQKLQDKVGSFAGTLTLGLAGGPGGTVQLDGTMSVLDIRNAINAKTATTGVGASVLQVASGDVRLVLTARDTGVAITLANGAGDDVLAKLGLSADGGATAQNLVQAASRARFTIDGVAFERSSNRVEDALQGVTFNLFKSEPGTSVKVDIERSLGAVKEKIVALADAYNAFRDFVGQQGKLGADGEVAADSPLFANRFLRDMQTRLASVAGGAATGGGSLGALGLSFDAANRMQIDDTKLDDALLTRLDQVRAILEFRSTSSSADLIVSGHAGPLQDPGFSVAIVDADADGTIDSATIDGVGVDVDGGIITGRAGTAYAGLQLSWVGSGSTTIAVTASQGIADRMFGELDKALDATDGRLAAEMGEIETSSIKAQEEIARINERAERHREQLIVKFSALEAALAQSRSMLQQIRAALGQSDDN